MTLKETIAHLRKSPADGWYYIQGEYRLFVYRRWPGLLRSHIKEQYEWRKKAAQLCYRQGQCKCCDCTTPDVFFADKACSIANPVYRRKCGHMGEPCYPRLMNRRRWITYKETLKK